MKEGAAVLATGVCFSASVCCFVFACSWDGPIRIHTLTHSLTHSFTHSFTPSLTLTHTHTHTHAASPSTTCACGPAAWCWKERTSSGEGTDGRFLLARSSRCVCTKHSLWSRGEKDSAEARQKDGRITTWRWGSCDRWWWEQQKQQRDWKEDGCAFSMGNKRRTCQPIFATQCTSHNAQCTHHTREPDFVVADVVEEVAPCCAADGHTVSVQTHAHRNRGGILGLVDGGQAWVGGQVW